MINDVTKLLRENPYPGRGIILGRSGDGERAVAVYFIMGRSENSRNRVFEATVDGVRTKAFDPDKLTDPSLVIYHPVRVANGNMIVTNGDQTETISDFLRDGRDFHDALMTREFEPDPPIYTPRISGIVNHGGSYRLSILKSAGGDPKYCQRHFYEYPAALPGVGHFISTYKSDGNPPPSFEGEPIPVKIDDANGLRKYAYAIWDALDADNKVSLYARETVIGTGASFYVIINKHGG